MVLAVHLGEGWKWLKPWLLLRGRLHLDKYSLLASYGKPSFYGAQIEIGCWIFYIGDSHEVGNDFEFWWVSQIQIRPSFLLEAYHVRSLWPSLTSYLDLMSISIKFSIFFRIFSSKVGPFSSLFLPPKKKKKNTCDFKTGYFIFIFFPPKKTHLRSQNMIF